MKFLLPAIFIATVAAFDGGNKPEMPVQVTNGDPDAIQPGTFSQFDRTRVGKCNSTPLLGHQTCYQDVDGFWWRYGCKAGEDKVYIDRCWGGCDNCDGVWKWGNERTDICYDDGTVLFKYSCGEHDAAHHDEEPSPEIVDEVITAPVLYDMPLGKTCTQLGWPLAPGSLSVCGASLVDYGKCSGVTDYVAAKRMCMSVGGRLCTAAELNNDETKGTGCKADCLPVWSANECTMADGSGTGHFVRAGSRKCSSLFPLDCKKSTDTAAHVRCCSDVGSGGDDMHYGDNVFLATSMDFDLQSRGCGGEPTSQYSCWTDPITGRSIRLGCETWHSKVLFQSCGSDTECFPENCSGPWQKNGEVMDQCYSSSENLYRYSCSVHN